VTAGSGNDVDPSCTPGGDLNGGKSMGALDRRTDGPASRDYVSLSANGRYVAFASAQSGPLNVWILDLETGKESPVAASSTMMQRFPVIGASGGGDEKTLLVFGGSPFQINLLDVASHRQTTMLKHPRYSLVDARFSPDNRWVSFTARIGPNRGWIMIAPIGGSNPVPESAWIRIAEEGAEDRANWSPDG